MDAPSLPFFIANLYQGLASARGIARITPLGLHLEFEVEDAVVGMIRSGLRSVQIPLDDLARLELRAGWFRTRLRIRTHHMINLRGVPGSHGGEIVLGVARDDRGIAQTMVSTLMLQQSERALEKLGRPAV